MDQISLAVSSLDHQCQVLSQSHLHQSTQSADGIRPPGKHSHTGGSESVSELDRLTLLETSSTMVSCLVSIQLFPCNYPPIRKVRPRNSTSHCNCESFPERRKHHSPPYFLVFSITSQMKPCHWFFDKQLTSSRISVGLCLFCSMIVPLSSVNIRIERTGHFSTSGAGVID